MQRIKPINCLCARSVSFLVIRVIGVLTVGASLACRDSSVAKTAAVATPPKPDEQPVTLNGDSPFRYPASLYAKKIQGKVTLRIYIDADGKVRPESTTVYEPSGYPALDSAAITGAKDMHFVPAKLHGESVPTVVLLPVIFKHPEVRAQLSDSK